MYRKTFTSIAFFLAIILALWATGGWAISWKNDLKSALEEARKNNKPIMVDFYTTWCHWCKELDKNTYSDSKVSALATKFICVKLDAEKDASMTEKYNVRGYPTVLFLNVDGSVNDRITGYRPPEPFATVMESVLNKTKSVDKIKNHGLQLNGVIIDKQNKLVAIINNTFVKEGDVISDGKVSKISKDKVEVSFKDETITLTMD